MKALLSVDLFVQVDSEEKCLSVFKKIDKEISDTWNPVKVEKYWKDDTMYVMSIKTEWEDDSCEKIAMQCMRLCKSFSPQWQMTMPEIENDELQFDGIANANMPIRYKGKGVQFLRFFLHATNQDNDQ